MGQFFQAKSALIHNFQSMVQKRYSKKGYFVLTESLLGDLSNLPPKTPNFPTGFQLKREVIKEKMFKCLVKDFHEPRMNA